MHNLTTSTRQKPIVLVLAAHDPSGGAGIQADIETLAAHGCIATPIITSLTCQNTQRFSYHKPQTSNDFSSQATLVIDDMPISACKIGAIGSTQLVETIHQIISRVTFPIVLDPVMRSTTGHDFSDPTILQLMRELLLPFITVITPNLSEARSLTNQSEPSAAANSLLAMGCKNVIVTDVTPSKTHVINHLYQQNDRHQTYSWQRLPGNYHGSGCTLSAAISAGLAQDNELSSTIERAQEFTWNSLKHGLSLSKSPDQGQIFPNRFFGIK